MTTGAGPAHIHITIYPIPPGITERLVYESTLPVAVSFTAVPSGVGAFTYLWDFGDGSTSTGPVVSHVFPTNCFYDVKLDAANSMGPSSSGAILFSVFSYKRTGGEMVACPQRGTAGITNVQLMGGYYAVGPLGVQVGNTVLANLTTDSNGGFVLDVTNHLLPTVNGTLYNFTTSAHNFRGTFLSLEGLRVSPSSGEPGDKFNLTGMSYPAYTTVSIYLGGANLGQVQTDGNGTFLAPLTVPSSIHYAGTYQFTTSPPVLGAQATFTVPVSSVTPAPPPNLFWPWILAVPAAIAILAGILLWRRRRPVDLEVFQEQLTRPFNTVWAIRVWGNKNLDKCWVTYDNTPLQTIVSPTGASLEMPLRKGESLDFRIPDTFTIVWEAWVVVKDGDKTVRSEEFGKIPHAKS